MYNAAEYPQGVPNPDYPDVNLYPTYEHGPDYTRPVFGEPWMRQPFNVMNGLGQNDSFVWKTTEDRARLAAQRYPRFAGLGQREPFYMAQPYWKGVGAAAALGVLLAAMSPMARKPRDMAQAAVAFGLVGVVAAAVTYATQPGAPA